MIFTIFILSLIAILLRPLNLGVWVYSSLGAFCVLLLGSFGLVEFTFEDLSKIFALVWDSSLALICLIVLCFCLEILGFFEYISHQILRVSRRNLELSSFRLCFFYLFLQPL
ncbi:hypothetical protein DMB92_06445 [Campylobacter sp. MIT 99-7217]|uniref:ArsB/NhaD family transporter n=1 Tax=Campylobacter sp. MIT 99-7217 TaxID=535091 RepID=UPI00115B6DF8|nr:ArsB/NhaD family transporter [Campylobacter sp. MIT 99-7217]TQR31324.1 hypothetical protein DMB92_06445 [Campylobacter sp. MIT 99-7217]